MVRAPRNFVLDEDTFSFDCLAKQEIPSTPKPPATPGRTVEPNFEFSNSLPSPSPADILFSNGLLQPHHFPLKPAANKPNIVEGGGGSRREPSPSLPNSNSSSRRESLPNSNSSSRRELSTTSYTTSRSNSTSSWSSSRNNSIGGGGRPQQMVAKDEVITRWEHFGDALPGLQASAEVRAKASRRPAQSGELRRCKSASAEAVMGKKRVEKGTGFCGSFVSACRMCKVVEPEKRQVSNNNKGVKVC